MRFAGTLRDKQAVAHTDELLGAALVQDDAGVSQRGGGEREARRHVGLDQAGDDVHGGALRREHQVDAGCTRLLRDAHDRLLDLLGRGHHQVGELVDHAHDERVRAHLALRAGRCLDVAAADLPVEVLDVAHARLLHVQVALLHLLDQPLEGGRGLLRLRNDRGDQVRDALVRSQLDHLGIHEDQADVLRGRAGEQRHQHRVDEGGLTGTGRAGHQQVRHLLHRGRDEVALDVLAQADKHRVLVGGHLRRVEHVAQSDHLAVAVRHLDAHGGLARDRGQQAYVVRRYRVRQVGLQVGDLGDFHAWAELDLVARHCRAARKSGDLGVDLELLEDVRNRLDHAVIRLGPRLRSAALDEQVCRRQRVVRVALNLARTLLRRVDACYLHLGLRGRGRNCGRVDTGAGDDRLAHGFAGVAHCVTGCLSGGTRHGSARASSSARRRSGTCGPCSLRRACGPGCSACNAARSFRGALQDLGLPVVTVFACAGGATLRRRRGRIVVHLGLGRSVEGLRDRFAEVVHPLSVERLGRIGVLLVRRVVVHRRAAARAGSAQTLSARLLAVGPLGAVGPGGAFPSRRGPTVVAALAAFGDVVEVPFDVAVQIIVQAVSVVIINVIVAWVSGGVEKLGNARDDVIVCLAHGNTSGLQCAVHDHECEERDRNVRGEALGQKAAGVCADDTSGDAARLPICGVAGEDVDESEHGHRDNAQAQRDPVADIPRRAHIEHQRDGDPDEEDRQDERASADYPVGYCGDELANRTGDVQPHRCTDDRGEANKEKPPRIRVLGYAVTTAPREAPAVVAEFGLLATIVIIVVVVVVGVVVMVIAAAGGSLCAPRTGALLHVLLFIIKRVKAVVEFFVGGVPATAATATITATADATGQAPEHAPHPARRRACCRADGATDHAGGRADALVGSFRGHH